MRERLWRLSLLLVVELDQVELDLVELDLVDQVELILRVALGRRDSFAWPIVGSRRRR